MTDVFVIVNVNAADGCNRCYVKPGNYSRAYYDTLGVAKAITTRLNKDIDAGGKNTPYQYKQASFVAMSLADYNVAYPPKTKVVKNLLSGKDCVIAEDTPLCCDPSSETYHSM